MPKALGGSGLLKADQMRLRLPSVEECQGGRLQCFPTVPTEACSNLAPGWNLGLIPASIKTAFGFDFLDQSFI